jgi:hypothetical protein
MPECVKKLEDQVQSVHEEPTAALKKSISINGPAACMRVPTLLSSVIVSGLLVECTSVSCERVSSFIDQEML